MSEEIYVSDHAVVRWLERVHEQDIEFFRNQIKNIVKDAIDAKATSITVDGFCYILDPISRSVVSVIHKDMKFRKKEKKTQKQSIG